MAARPSFRGRMGVEDSKDGEQERDGEGVLVRGKGGSPQHPESEKGPLSIKGGRSRDSAADETTTAGYNGDSASGDMSPPNTVAMPITARGGSAPGAYDSTGEKLNVRGSLGNTVQNAYNDRPGQGGSSEGDKKGKMMATEPSNFYNDVGGNKNDMDGNASQPRAKRIEGFGGGKSTFQSFSEDYNDLGGKGALVGRDDGEGDSGSGTIFAAKGSGAAKKITGFSSEDGLKSGMV